MYGDTTAHDQAIQGISLTTDGSANRPRTHIWTFAISNDRNGNFGCPCTSAQAPQPPNFVGSDYFCEGGGDPLWDGEDCIVLDACSCTEDQGNGPLFFCVRLILPLLKMWKQGSVLIATLKK